MRAAAWIAGVAVLLALLFWGVSRLRSPEEPSEQSRSESLSMPSRTAKPGKPAGRPLRAARRARPEDDAPESPAPRDDAAEPSPATPAAPEAPKAPALPTPADKLRTLEDILALKDDNDPRLDSDFNDLSPEAKRLFREKYRSIPREGRNKRGTIVFLLGRNLKTEEDWAFLHEVISEPPCLSLGDCSTKGGPSDGHRGIGAEVTLAYPSLVALRQAARTAEDPRGPAGGMAAREASRLVRAAKGSPVPVVASKARDLERRLSGR
ncbi:MAG: hypothetical protein ABII00_00945 [Elusimicrobiota bacterium]